MTIHKPISKVKLVCDNVDDNHNNKMNNNNESNDNSDSDLTIDFSKGLWLENFVDFMILLKCSVGKESKHEGQRNK